MLLCARRNVKPFGVLINKIGLTSCLDCNKVPDLKGAELTQTTTLPRLSSRISAHQPAVQDYRSIQRLLVEFERSYMRVYVVDVDTLFGNAPIGVTLLEAQSNQNAHKVQYTRPTDGTYIFCDKLTSVTRNAKMFPKPNVSFCCQLMT